MRRISSHLLMVCGMCLLLLVSCQKASDFTVQGVVSGADGQVMYLENVGVSTVQLLDSVKLTAAGRFKFTKPRPQFPDFYRFRLGKQLINFSIDSTETVTFEADAGTFATSYKVEGSENCRAIKDITLAQLDANQAINKLRKDYENKQISDTLYSSQMIEVVNNYKKEALKYIYAAPMSTAAYYALFQQIDGLLFFDLYDRTDSKAFGAVATSYDHYYPESPRSKHLYNLALQSLKVIRGQRPIDLDSLVTDEIDHLEIELPNVQGEPVKLSDVAKDHITVLNFTAYQTEWSPALNMTLGDLYTKYQERGLVIYQVSLDSDMHMWRNAASNLPWTCVIDPQSVYSQVAALYNVKQLPVLFILDRKGTLLKRLDDPTRLEAELKALL
ncbi:MAG: redoxin domain-containing protein [Parabacteroides sp.]